MKKILILSAVLLAFAVPAFATIDLSWNACPAQGGVGDVVIDCANPSAVHTLYGVVSTPDAITGFVALDCILDLQVDRHGSLTAFHNLYDPVANPTGCNTGWVFGDERGAATVCAASALLWGASPPPGGGQGTATAGYGPNPAVSRGRIATSTFRSSTAPINLVANTLYFGFKIDFYTYDATGNGGAECEGCDVPMRIALNEARFGSLGAVNGVEAAPVIVTQPGTFGIESSTFGGGSIPAGATPVKNHSWGALKSLYR
jgi:hypothetical protein